MASMSGVAANDSCVGMWEKLKAGKIKSCQFKVENKEIVPIEESVQEKGAPDAWKSFTQSLPESECRYAIYDVAIKLDMGPGVPAGERTKLTFIIWSPDSAPIRQKMVSASSKDALKKKFEGIQVEWQLTSPEDLDASDRISDLSTKSDIKTSGRGILSFEGIAA
ncbi:Oidioi.mRNA.OKI2018_I69.chr1.g3379.t1.cds [Oikopleura dioica]|uniref:Oidioi.mRNA.OKI2018_I69.chr1.g3379.t1.cds n=1 Tax=Oikopleura dioica TaxID=34765 RepID=A0ABN7SY89_OIKDI|nr:Oidioi.mRNA.OKI2018_I69.chr1.g3379.t1.cds [Oikopleura dioica]